MTKTKAPLWELRALPDGRQRQYRIAPLCGDRNRQGVLLLLVALALASCDAYRVTAQIPIGARYARVIEFPGGFQKPNNEDCDGRYYSPKWDVHYDSADLDHLYFRLYEPVSHAAINCYSTNAFEVTSQRSGAFAVKGVDFQEWRRHRRSIEITGYLPEDLSRYVLCIEPNICVYRERPYQLYYPHSEGPRMSPDGSFLAIPSWEGHNKTEQTKRTAWGTLPVYFNYSLDIFDTATGTLVTSARGKASRIDPKDLLWRSTWIENRYFVLPLSNHGLVLFDLNPLKVSN